MLRATNDLARAHGATPLLVVLQFGHEEGAEQVLRRRVLDDASIPYVLIDIDSSWRLAWDRHPNARAAHAIFVHRNCAREEEARASCSRFWLADAAPSS